MVRHSCSKQVVTLNFRHNEDTSSSTEVKLFKPLQQVKHTCFVPMFADPNFGTVVLEKQWTLKQKAGSDASPGKAAVALINKIGRRRSNNLQSAGSENQVVA